MRKINAAVLLLSAILLMQVPAAVFAQSSTVSARSPVVDTGGLNKGVVTVSYDSGGSKAKKVMIKKGEVKYVYDLKESSSLPFQSGNGEYEVSVLENISGNKYRIVYKKNVTLNISDSRIVYLQSVQPVNWNADMKAVRKAGELTAGLKNDREKAEAVYNYVVNTLSYDNEKIGELSTDYVPSVEAVFAGSKGICYDYAVLTAAMLRSIGIPAKLVMGYKDDIEAYHAWNQVYIKESGKWITIDTTYDSILKDSKRAAEMEKDADLYKIERQY